jgi:VIT1/CCC1 family predicted Fe2+/Mn2+ transporter
MHLTDGDRSAPRRASSWREIERSTLREVLMGAQDNLTNVLAVVLGVAIGAGRADLVALAGLAAGTAESISMAGVLYTSTRAERDLAQASDAAAAARLEPWQAGAVTFAAALVGGLVPLLPFAVLSLGPALIASLGISIAALFALGAWTASVTGRRWRDEGIRLVLIAGAAAVAAAMIGALLRVD